MVATDKIKDLRSSTGSSRSPRKGRKVVHCHGVFDLLHIGHIRHFEQARKHGDLLVVTVTPDRYVNKGPHRPVFSERAARRGGRVARLRRLRRDQRVADGGRGDRHHPSRLLRQGSGLQGRGTRPHRRHRARAKRPSSRPAGALVIHRRHHVQLVEPDQPLPAGLSQGSERVPGRLRRPLPGGVRRRLPAEGERAARAGRRRGDHRRVSLLRDAGKVGQGADSRRPVQERGALCRRLLAIANHIASFAGRVQLVTELGEYESHESFVRGALHAGRRTPRCCASKARPRSSSAASSRRIRSRSSSRSTSWTRSGMAQVGGEPVPAARGDHRRLRRRDRGGLRPRHVDRRRARSAVRAREVPRGERADQRRQPRLQHGVEVPPRRFHLALGEGDPARGAQSVRRPAGSGQLGRRSAAVRPRHRDAWRPGQPLLRPAARASSRCRGSPSAPSTVSALATRCLPSRRSASPWGRPWRWWASSANAVGTEAVSIVGNQRFIERVPLIKHIEALLK